MYNIYAYIVHMYLKHANFLNEGLYNKKLLFLHCC